LGCGGGEEERERARKMLYIMTLAKEIRTFVKTLKCDAKLKKSCEISCHLTDIGEEMNYYPSAIDEVLWLK